MREMMTIINYFIVIDTRCAYGVMRAIFTCPDVLWYELNAYSRPPVNRVNDWTDDGLLSECEVCGLIGGDPSPC